MRILICSDGTDPADKPVLLAGLVAAPTKAQTTLLGIAETSADDKPLRDALDGEAEKLRRFGVSPEIVVRTGEPIREILEQTKTVRYDMTIIGTRRKTSSGPYWRSGKTYEVIKAIPTPVLLATGVCEALKSFIVCTGGKKYIDAAVELTGKLAAAVGASVTLLHVMAEPPAIYADLMQLEEDVERLLQSGSELGRNLLAQKQSLEKLGVVVEVRVRHGFVVDQIFADTSERGHDLIVTGSSPTRGPLGHYIMGDLTREIVNRANVPVLVARSAKNGGAPPAGVWSTLKQLVASSWGKAS
jgi:nucleotide-binding universal stress UspA family protein